jgi:hypothetical protein
MDARLARAAILAAAILCLGAGYRTPNFVVTAPTPQVAEQIGRQAEKYRHDLAIEWLGQPLPNWLEPCPIRAQVNDRLGAGGATSFMFNAGEVFGWEMTIQGSLERVLDSVLPHEVTHTIFASYFRRPLPRWADEGACTTVEHASERSKQQIMLIDFLKNKRGIPFHQMFAMKEYPHDILPLYAQGHSLASFLIGQGGRRKFLGYVAAGLEGEQWSAATRQFYGYSNLAELQKSWLDWVRKGSPESVTPKQPAPSGHEETTTLAQATPRPQPAPSPIYRGQSRDLPDAPADRLVPVIRTRGRLASGSEATQLASAAGPSAVGRTDQSADQGWRARGAVRAATAAVAAGATYNQLTRPQGIEGSRQVILEWERPNTGSASASAPNNANSSTRNSSNASAMSRVQPPLPRPDADQRNGSAPRRSVYEVRGEAAATLRR